jgi:hypothetical protein
MSHLRSLPPVIVLALLLVGSTVRAEEPQLLPTRDVDVTYDVTRPKEPKIRERRRWLADEHLERVDGPDKSSTIFDVDKGEFTLLNPKTRTFRKLEGARPGRLTRKRARCSSAATRPSWRDCTAPIGRGPRMSRRTPYAPRRTA